MAVGVALVSGGGAGCGPSPGAERPHALGSAPTPAGGVDAVVLVDRPPLRAGSVVQVRARSITRSVKVGDARFDQVLIGERWFVSDAIATRAREDDPMRGTYLPRRALDLDGDGAPDRIWHAVHESEEDDTGRLRRQGYLVLEGRHGVRTLPLASSDGWGSAERFAEARLFDVVGTPEPDLVAVFDTDTCEVGPTGHRLVVVTFGGGEPTVAVAHDVNDPVLVGLAQYRVGSVRVRGREVVARTVVTDVHPALRSFVRVDRWRGGAHEAWDEPLRTLDGELVGGVTAGPLGPDEPAPEAWIDDPAGRRVIAIEQLAEPLYVRALREWGTATIDWRDWVTIDAE